jgi:hypothetical protein
VIYSYVEGPTNQPLYYPGVETVIPGFQVSFEPVLDAPGCTACMGEWTNTWIHSSGVYSFRNGVPYVLTTMVFGNPALERSKQIINVATSTATGDATALQVIDGQNGAGPLASEIAMPLRFSGGKPDEALIVYDYTGPTFYPGIKSVTWSVDRNTVHNADVVKQGLFTPPPNAWFMQAQPWPRWVDFIAALVPIPGTSTFVLAGQLAASSTNDAYRATYWTTTKL